MPQSILPAAAELIGIVLLGMVLAECSSISSSDSSVRPVGRPGVGTPLIPRSSCPASIATEVNATGLLSVMHLSASADGVTDDSEAVQRAVRLAVGACGGPAVGACGGEVEEGAQPVAQLSVWQLDGKAWWLNVKGPHLSGRPEA